MTLTPSGRRWTAARRKSPASYYLQASESGGEPPGRWRARAQRPLASATGGRIECRHDRNAGGLDLCKAAVQRPISAIPRLSRLDSLAYDLLSGKRQAPDGTRLGRAPSSGGKAAGHEALFAAAPHATAECERRLCFC